MDQSYDAALFRLSQLASNRKVTLQFENQENEKQKSPPDPNKVAIPEMITWLHRAGYKPQDLAKIRHLHIAGTKGKGSVCAYATSILRQYGAVGTYTSPHLISPRERIAINGEPISQDEFAAAFFEVWDRLTEAALKEGSRAEEAEGPMTKPFFFRFLTIMAWHIFLQRGINVVVMECGIGGEYDPTNILPAEAVSAAVVTQLGIDHVAMLGDTVEKIAWHKAGIFKPGVRAFTRRLEDKPAVIDVLRQRAVEKGADLTELNDQVVRHWGGVRGNLPGDFQKFNQALAVLAVGNHLGQSTDPNKIFEQLPDKFVQGLGEAKLRGRCEVVERPNSTWLLDGAHTVDSLKEVAAWVHGMMRSEAEQLILIFNQQDRDASELLKTFLKAAQYSSGKQNLFSHAIFTRNELRAPESGQHIELGVQEKAAAMMNKLASECRTQITTNLHDAVAEAEKLLDRLGGGRKILVTGSLHLVGGVLQVLEPNNLL